VTGFAIRGSGIELSAWRALPITGPQDDRNENRPRQLHAGPWRAAFPFRSNNLTPEIEANKQKNDVVGFDVLVDVTAKFRSGTDAPVVPHFDHSLSLENGELRLKLVRRFTSA
jgi:hypothetical protein